MCYLVLFLKGSHMTSNSSVTKIDLQKLADRTEDAYAKGSWRELPIQECNEPLAQVTPALCHSFYSWEMNLTTDRRIFLRKSVAEMFLEANRIISASGIRLVIYDGWRSVALQENLFWYYLKIFTAAKFNVQDHFSQTATNHEVKEAFLLLPLDLQEKLKEANRMYVSWPSSDPLRPSPHSTGGSIDVWPFRFGRPVDLGVPFDWMEDNAGAFYHLKTERLKFENDLAICRNRELLLEAMVGAGFSCYPPEIWHFNFGNQMDSLVTGEIARYSYIEP